MRARIAARPRVVAVLANGQPALVRADLRTRTRCATRSHTGQHLAPASTSEIVSTAATCARSLTTSAAPWKRWKKRCTLARHRSANSSRGSTSYWTQQWLSIRMTWYKLRQRGMTRDHGRSIGWLPICRSSTGPRVCCRSPREIDPERGLAAQATPALRSAPQREQLQEIARRTMCPLIQFARRMREHPGHFARPATHPTGLRSTRSFIPTRSPGCHAFTAMTDRDPESVRWPYWPAIRQMPKPVADSAGRPAKGCWRGSPSAVSASAASAVVGGIPGIVISLGAAGFGDHRPRKLNAQEHGSRAQGKPECRRCGDLWKPSWWTIPRPASWPGSFTYRNRSKRVSPGVLTEPVELVPQPPERPLRRR